MKIGPFEIQPDAHCWVLKEIKTYKSGKHAGKVYKKTLSYPATFAQALEKCLDLMVMRELAPDASLLEAVATVAFLYRRVNEYGRARD